MLTFEQAWQAAQGWDWPGAMAFDPRGFTNALVWLPFDPKTGRNAVAPTLAELASLRLPAGVQTRTLPKPTERDTLVPSVDAAATLRVPCWIFGSFPPGAGVLLERASERAEPYWVAVEATSGAVMGGRLPAVRLMAHLRLWALLCLVLLGMSIALTTVVTWLKWPTEWLRNCVVARALDARTVIGVPVILGGLAFLGWRLRSFTATAAVIVGKGLPPWLVEPAIRADRGELRFPSDQRWRRILGVFGWVMLVSMLLQFLFLGGLIRLGLGLRGLPFLLSIVCGLFAAVSAIRRSRVVAPSPAAPLDDRYEGPAALLVESVLRVMALALAGLFVGSMVFYGAIVVGAERLIHEATFYVPAAVRLGAAVGTAVIRAPGRARITLSVAVIVEGLLGLYLDDWLTAIVVAAVVIATSVPAGQGASGTLPSRFARAARGAWSYSLGAAIGRLAGRVLGGLLVGPLGAVVGESVGEPVLAALGWLHSQRDASESRALAPPLQRRTRP